MNRFAVTALIFSALVLVMTASPRLAAAHGPSELASQIESTHGIDAWRSKQAVKFHADVAFGGNNILDATFIYNPHNGRVRMELADGTVSVFDGEKAWITPTDEKFTARARFHLLTWPYFLAAPFKLQDPGSSLAPFQPGGHNSAKLTFDAGVGDTPDDWYVVYQNPENQSLDAMAYIVTYGKPAEKAEKKPHAIQYANIVEVDGVKLSTDWTFFVWTAEKGMHGDPIGTAKITNIEFVTPKTEHFTKPEGATEAPLPPAE